MQEIQRRKAYLQHFLQAFSYPQDAIADFLSVYDDVCNNPTACEALFRLIGVYEKEMRCDFLPLAQEVEKLSQETGVCLFSLQAVFYMLLTEKMQAYYAERGVSERIWHDTVLDLRVKCIECKKVKGVWGIFAIRWFFNLFRGNIFRLGRLEFCLRSFGAEYQKDGLILHPDTLVIDTHIPSGEPLVYQEVLQSYKQAMAFFKQYYGVEPPAFWCKSWLLSPVHKSALKESSNIKKFADDFDVYDCLDHDGYAEIFMRVFEKEYTADFDLRALPCDTTLQKFYVEYMQQGKITSSGKGVLDCRKVLKKLSESK